MSRFTIENSTHSITVNGELSNYPNTTIGDTSSFEFYIKDHTDLSPAPDRYRTLKDYLNYAGYAIAERTEKSVYFWEDGYNRAPIDTLLVSIQPDDSIEEARGVWGIITGGSDSTEVFGSQARIDLDVFVLAEYDDYATESDVRNAFEADASDLGIVVGTNLPSDQQLTLSVEDIQRSNPVKTHTGKGDLTATVKGNRDLEPYAQRQDRINVNIGGSTQWTGYLIDVSHNTSTTRIKADGIEKRLEETRPDYDTIGGPVSYSNIPLEDALRDYWPRTPFTNFSVTDQETELVAEDDEVQSADTNSEWEGVVSIGDETPLTIEGGELTTLQTCWVFEAENADSGFASADASSNDDYSGGDGQYFGGSFAGVGDHLEFTFTPDYDVPGLTIALREDGAPGDNDTGDEVTVPGMDITVNGTTLESLGDGGTMLISGLGWDAAFESTETTFNAGDQVTVRFEVTEASAGNYGEWIHDTIAIYDSRYNYDFDNTVHEPQGYLDGPQTKPDEITVETETTTTSFNVKAASVSSSWDDTSGNQSIGVSNGGGDTYQTETNTDVINKSFDDPGREVGVEFTLGRYGTRDTETPRTGFNSQAIDSYTAIVDGDNLVVIDELELSRNHFDNLSTLCEYGDFLYVVEHDSGPIEDLVVSCFQRGDETRPSPDAFDNPKNQQPEIQSGTYYNSIYLEGALRSDGTRPTSEVKDQDAIDRDGREISPGVLRDQKITTEAGADFRAEALLSTALDNNNLVGSVTVPPTITDPGYAREIDLGDGLKEKTVEEVSLSLGTNSAEATFDFSVRSGFAEDITSLKRQSRDVGDQV